MYLPVRKCVASGNLQDTCDSLIVHFPPEKREAPLGKRKRHGEGSAPGENGHRKEEVASEKMDVSLGN